MSQRVNLPNVINIHEDPPPVYVELPNEVGSQPSTPPPQYLQIINHQLHQNGGYEEIFQEGETSEVYPDSSPPPYSSLFQNPLQFDQTSLPAYDAHFIPHPSYKDGESPPPAYDSHFDYPVNIQNNQISNSRRNHRHRSSRRRNYTNINLAEVHLGHDQRVEPSSGCKNTCDHVVFRIIICLTCAAIGTGFMIYYDKDKIRDNVLFNVGVIIVVVGVCVFMIPSDKLCVQQERPRYQTSAVRRRRMSSQS